MYRFLPLRVSVGRLCGGDPRRLVGRVVGYAISRSIGARLTLAALKAAIRMRQPPKGCIIPIRGSQYASQAYREMLAKHGLEGSMGRRGNPYDNAKAESFIKTLKVAVYLMAYKSGAQRLARWQAAPRWDGSRPEAVRCARF